VIAGARRRPGTLAVQCVFAALVLSTFAAFFVTTKLKRSPQLVEQVSFRRHFSPNGDGRLDVEKIAFSLRRSDDTSVAIVTRDDETVAVLADDVRLKKGRHRFVWNGRDASGRVAPDGEYRVRVRLRHQGRSIVSSQKLFVDTAPPEPIVRSVSPDVLYPGARKDGRARIRFIGPTRTAPTLLVYRAGGERPRLVARRIGRKHDPIVIWNGRVGLGLRSFLAPSGNYLMVIRTRDASGNDGTSSLLPTGGPVKGHPELNVRKRSGKGRRG